MSQNLLVCQHCQTYFFTNLEETNLCPHCNSKLEVSNITYENYKSMSKVKKCKNCKRKYPKIFIKCPKCNQQLIKLSTENKQLDKQVNEIRKEIQEHQEKQQNTPKCPTCGSTNVGKISAGKKAIGFVAVGVFSSNFGKTMKCKNCGYKW